MPTPCTNTLDYLYTGNAGSSTDWSGDEANYWFQGTGEPDGVWTAEDDYFFTGNGTTTDFCAGDRTIASFRGTLTVDLVPSVTYKVVVTQPRNYDT